MLHSLAGSNPLTMIHVAGRFNVSVTRAKRKNIIIVSDSLLFRPTAAILDDAATAEGFSYMASVLETAKAEAVALGVPKGEGPVFDLNVAAFHTAGW